MNNIEFIRKHLTDILTAEGRYSLEAVEAGIRHFRTVPNAAQKGRIFDECLKVARTYAGNKRK